MLRIYRRIETITNEILVRFSREFTRGTINEDDWNEIKQNVESLKTKAQKAKESEI